MNINTQIQNDSTSIKETFPILKTLYEEGPEILKEIEEMESRETIKTDSFFLPTIMPGMLYTIVGMTNVGKTYFSLGTAIGLAAEGHKVGYLTTEDTKIDLVSHMRKLDFGRNEIYKNFVSLYINRTDESGFIKAMKTLEFNGCDVIIVDYIQASMLKSHNGDLNLTMGIIDALIRDFIQKYKVTVINLVQANAAMYKQPIAETIKKNPDNIMTMISGGFTSGLTTHVLGILVKNEQGKRGIYLKKAKDPYTDQQEKVFEYGEVNANTFQIRYKEPVPVREWFEGKTAFSGDYKVEVNKSSVNKKYVKVRGK